MTTMTTIATDRDALAERLVEATVGTLELFGVYLGTRLGLYEVLSERADVTVDELAEAAGIDPRYAREWLEQQAVAGILTLAGASDGERRFALPAPHREVLAEAENPAFVAPFSLMVAGIAQALPEVVQAYRMGDGVAWTSYGADGREGQAAINRPVFADQMATWIAAMPDVESRLAQPGARVADLGCGGGWSAIAMARTFPTAHVDGYDVDESSIIQARENAERAGMSSRVTFSVSDASAGPTDVAYDLVGIFEALHDMPRPVEALATARAMLAPGGSVLVVDERVADAFVAPGDLVERMMYGWSITCCLPTCLVDPPSAATGTVMRTEVLRRYATEAGFSRVEVLDVDNDFFRLYRLGR